MGKTQVAEKDKAALEQLEALVKEHQPIDTAELSRLSGLGKDNVRDLLKQHSFNVSADYGENGGSLTKYLWRYRPKVKDIARPHRA